MIETYGWADHRIFAAPDAADGRALLFGTDHASLFALDAATQTVVDRWRNRETIVVHEAPTEDREVLEALCDAQVLMPSAWLRRPAPAPLDPAAIPLGTLVLEAAQACNLRCTYCYAGGGSYGGAARVMPPELARRAARYLVESSGDRQECHPRAVRRRAAAQSRGVEGGGAGGRSRRARLRQEVCRLADDQRHPLHPRSARLPQRASDFGLGQHRRPARSARRQPSLPRRQRRRHLRRHRRRPRPLARAHAAATGRPGDADAGPVGAGARSLRPSARPRLSRSGHRAGEPDQRGTPAYAGAGRDAVHRLRRARAAIRVRGSGRPRAAVLQSPRCPRQAARGTGQERTVRRRARLPRARHRGPILSVPPPGRRGAVPRRRSRLPESITRRSRRASPPRRRRGRTRASACWARSLCAGGCHHENHVRESDLGQAPGGSCDFIRRWLELGIRVYADLCRDPDNPVLAFLGRRADG